MASPMLVLVVPRWPAARGLLRNGWELLLRTLQQSRPGLPGPPWGPALAVQGPAVFTEPAHDTSGSKEISSLLDSIFWMAAPKNRRSIEVNRCRRRNPQKLIKVKNNIDVCPECGHLKLKHVLCGFCYEKVCKETAEIRRQIGKQEGGPFKAPPVETVVLYTGEAPSIQDQGKRIIERDRKRPSWFTQN
ncbi:large ribosomal subunit protein bL32m [Canis lupus baileyi]|uniref:Large ribosomal subunit protein bL32m n=2 Tax=Canis lupus TaxID=9612 RepID=A0A8C0MFI8_CANLF|nr:39S ribosomal protein L32, mitochondrial [Canis lupus dingo]XP_038279629.1 39S ribosomal protein L32, mitochondrial [Canis lupus familiaris]XP_038418580.1 39S ribosomal protein L32, mitochondrial [Canis lupus familiaris]XP_533077.1 39S ribosomal protein L32, mitochondrial [Canis lupus familiaris]|eukprot:XP_533077.1 39S ribosomal protein L32, mitochondrial [Canis lupus familiaris]